MVDSKKKKDFYGMLQVEKTATPAEIRTSYKKLALVSHRYICNITTIEIEMASRQASRF